MAVEKLPSSRIVTVLGDIDVSRLIWIVSMQSNASLPNKMAVSEGRMQQWGATYDPYESTMGAPQMLRCLPLRIKSGACLGIPSEPTGSRSEQHMHFENRGRFPKPTQDVHTNQRKHRLEKGGPGERQPRSRSFLRRLRTPLYSSSKDTAESSISDGRSIASRDSCSTTSRSGPVASTLKKDRERSHEPQYACERKPAESEEDVIRALMEQWTNVKPEDDTGYADHGDKKVSKRKGRPSRTFAGTRWNKCGRSDGS